jgi:hypothetical protein
MKVVGYIRRRVEGGKNKWEVTTVIQCVCVWWTLEAFNKSGLQLHNAA